MSYEYLATPFKHEDKSVQNIRYWQAVNIAARLWKEGRPVFTPIGHTYEIAFRAGLKGGFFDHYQEFDTAMIDGSKGIIVAMMDGWEISEGINAEIGIALGMEKPIVYLDIDAWTFSE